MEDGLAQIRQGAKIGELGMMQRKAETTFLFFPLRLRGFAREIFFPKIASLEISPEQRKGVYWHSPTWRGFHEEISTIP